jgi:penicillin-binding protein 2
MKFSPVPRPARLVTEQSQAFTFTRRALLLGGAQLGVGALLAGRMAWLSIAENEHYRVLAESNRVQLVLIPPRRGWIVDRYGRPIAINRTDFRVDIIPDRLKDRDATLAALQSVLGLPPEEMERVHDELAKAAGYQPVPVAEHLDYERYAAVTLRLPSLAGVAPASGYARFYPAGAAVGHLVGYVGTASAADYEANKNPLLITPGFKVGKEGLEKTMEERLRGQPGAKRAEVTARGKVVRELTTRPETSGAPLQLTIDAGLQEYAGRRLGEESGSAVVIDVDSGDLLCMASMPCYDPNSFSDGISHSEWDMLSQDPRHPLINKVLGALYPPGSTFKPAVAMAALEAGIDPDQQVSCPGGFRLGNRFFKCLGRHGPMNMHRAIAKSCNTYFYTMGNRIGFDRVADMARRLGLGQEFDLPVASQRYGTIPDSAWKERKYKQKWSGADTLNASIGQGFVLLNPLQLAVMASRVASGNLVQPRLLRHAGGPLQPLPFAAEHFQTVRGGMWEVVNGNGTAGASRLPLDGIQMAGKTGTAQVRRIVGSQRGQSGDWKYRDHGLFVFFAPTDRPRYAGSVVIEHGMGGARAAAPVARDILTYLFDREKALKRLHALEQDWGGDLATRMTRQGAEFRAAQAVPPAPPPPPAPAPPAATAGNTAAPAIEID